jgi:hypothetical protein
MKRDRILWVTLAVAALVGLAVVSRHGLQPDPAAPPDTPVTRQADEAGITPVPAAKRETSYPAVGVKSSSQADPVAAAPAGIAKPPPGRSAARLPDPGERFVTLATGLRPKVDAALLASDFVAADRHVDEALKTPGLKPIETQRLMAMKMAGRGMRGDHAAMLALMDEIIAVAPDSELSARLRQGRPQVEKIHRLGPDHPVLCETCGRIHAPGAHPAAHLPSNSSPPPTR